MDSHYVLYSPSHHYGDTSSFNQYHHQHFWCFLLKVHSVVFGEKTIRRERFSLTDLFMPKQTKWTNSLWSHDWINKLITQFHTHLHCLYLADPATFLASNSVLETLFSSETSLFIHLRDRYIFLSLYYDLINIVNVEILSLNFFSRTTQCPTKTLWTLDFNPLPLMLHLLFWYPNEKPFSLLLKANI